MTRKRTHQQKKDGTTTGRSEDNWQVANQLQNNVLPRTLLEDLIIPFCLEFQSGAPLENHGRVLSPNKPKGCIIHSFHHKDECHRRKTSTSKGTSKGHEHKTKRRQRTPTMLKAQKHKNPNLVAKTSWQKQILNIPKELMIPTVFFSHLNTNFWDAPHQDINSRKTRYIGTVTV